MTIKSCSRDCPDRSATCHATCKKYADALAEHQTAKKKLRLQQELDQYEWGAWRGRRRTF